MKKHSIVPDENRGIFYTRTAPKPFPAIIPAFVNAG